jgi:heme-degrading monooxygenase HmoA
VVITLFRSRLRPEAHEEYERWAGRMARLAATMPGFVSLETYGADDGARISVIAFDSEVTHGAWRDHPEHREAQRLGRERFYSEYDIQVCTPVRRYAFSHSAARPAQD